MDWNGLEWIRDIICMRVCVFGGTNVVVLRRSQSLRDVVRVVVYDKAETWCVWSVSRGERWCVWSVGRGERW
jgi:hypothetical protein